MGKCLSDCLSHSDCLTHFGAPPVYDLVQQSRIKEMGESFMVNDALSTVTWTDVMKLRDERKKTSMARFYEANPASSVSSVYRRDNSVLL